MKDVAYALWVSQHATFHRRLQSWVTCGWLFYLTVFNLFFAVKFKILWIPRQISSSFSPCLCSDVVLVILMCSAINTNDRRSSNLIPYISVEIVESFIALLGMKFLTPWVHLSWKTWVAQTIKHVVVCLGGVNITRKNLHIFLPER